MREIVIISGKGGAGKTSLAAAFAHLAGNKIICDLDVDAPDLHLVLQPQHERQVSFYAGNQARIEQEQCTSCGICRDLCSYAAISLRRNSYRVDPIRCKGCKVCVTFCPEQIIGFPAKHCGTWYVSSTRLGIMVHAQLFPGEENSGRLVALLKNEARILARKSNIDLILSDGASGIGHPVVSSLSGAHFAVLVTEPTPSGQHDLERVASLCERFHIPAGVIINKADLNPEQAETIEQYCRQKNYPILARLPYDPVITEAMVEAVSVTERGETEIGKKIGQAWKRIEGLLG